MSNSAGTPREENTVEMEPESAPLPVTSLAGGLSLPQMEYRGAQTIKAVSTAREELAAMLTGAGVYDLGWRSLLRCAGPDRVRWLNGMVTNSVKDLGDDAGCYAFVLNAQGRIQGDLDIYRPAFDPEALWLETDRSQIALLTAFLRHYIIMDQVTLEPLDKWTALGVAGPAAAEKIRSLDFPVADLSPMHLADATWKGHRAVLLASYSPSVPRFEIWVESATVADLWSALKDTGCQACGAEAVEQLRILDGIPAYGIDIADRDLPQETNQMRALNFTKGCYLGQEIVERIRSRGNVHRTFSGFRMEREPEADRSLTAEGKSVGEITSFARVSVPGGGERVLALGRIRREAIESTVSTGEGIVAMPSPLPFEFADTAGQP